MSDMLMSQILLDMLLKEDLTSSLSHLWAYFDLTAHIKGRETSSLLDGALSYDETGPFQNLDTGLETSSHQRHFEVSGLQILNPKLAL